MKKKLIGILMTSSMLTQASALDNDGTRHINFNISSGQHEYEHLGDLFKTGVRPNLKKISNIALSGRCFLKHDSSGPINAGYLFRPLRNEAALVSLTTEAYEAFSYWRPSVAPNYFDTMNAEKIFQVLPNLRATNVKIKKDSIEIAINESKKSILKASGRYLIEKITHSNEDHFEDLRCYYFVPGLDSSK